MFQSGQGKDLVTKARAAYNLEGLPGVIKKTYLKLQKALFVTNSAFWFRKDLNKSLTLTNNPSKGFYAHFNSWHETKKFLKDNHHNFPWMYIEEEINVANECNHIFPGLWHNSQMIGYLKIGFDKVYVHDFDNIINIPGDTAFIYDFFVIPEYRMKGLGELLISESLLFLKSKGYKYVWCHIPGWNKPSIKAFESCGFEKIKSIRFLRMFTKKMYLRDPEKLLKTYKEVDEKRRDFFQYLIGGLLMFVLFDSGGKNNLIAANEKKESSNKYPMKVKQNDVISVQNEAATNWDYKGENHLDYINQEVVDQMVDQGILKLTGMGDLTDAWKRIMVGYVAGDKIAIKPNFNNIIHGNRQCFITSPQVIKSLIRGLVDYLKVREEQVYVYDLCKKIPKELVRDRIRYNVNYVEGIDFPSIWEKVKVRLGWDLSCADKNARINMRNRIPDGKGGEIFCYIPRVVTEAKHLINACLLTNHVFIPVSGPLKNHFGTVRFSNYNQYPVCLHGDRIEDHIADINLDEHIKNKTRLYVCDGLFGVFSRGEKGGINKWETFPCKSGTPNTILFSFDPFSMEKKMAEIVIRERKHNNLKIFKKPPWLT
jgi:ribosomal protein S18 acetylase RimI-like enzyme